MTRRRATISPSRNCARRIARNEAQSSVRAASPDLQPNPASVALLQRVIEPMAPAVFAISHARAAPLTDPPDPLPRYLSLLVLRN